MDNRKKVDKKVEAEVLIASRRRCCLCVFLDDYLKPKPGQIAHLNRDRTDSTFDNLVFLCLEHHHLYDSRSNQAKGFNSLEVKTWRDYLYGKFPSQENQKSINKVELHEIPSTSEYEELLAKPQFQFLKTPWHYPLWQVANQPEFFAYKARLGFDGICLIERIDIPDGRIVIACIQTAGNPGKSITNAVEDLALQVCVRFDIPADKLVWLEHYEDRDPECNEWHIVSFASRPPKGPFAKPTWTKISEEMWSSLKLRPRKTMKIALGQYQSALIKRFHWPTESLLD